MEITHNGRRQSLDDYLDKLKQRIPSLATKRSSKPKVDLMHEARIFKAELDKLCPSGSFVIEPDKRELINSVLAWVWKFDKWNRCGLDYSKGFFLYGPVGTGKSTLIRGLQMYTNSIKRREVLNDHRIGFYWKSASELANSYAGDGQEKLLQWCEDCSLMIDELGREPLPAKHYGTSLNVIQFVLQLRYDHRLANVTHITSNLMLSDITPMYGDYISDRFREMFNIIEWSGESKR